MEMIKTKLQRRYTRYHFYSKSKRTGELKKQ